MRLKTTLLSAGSALDSLEPARPRQLRRLLKFAVHMRAGPGTQYEVVDTIPGGATVDVAGMHREAGASVNFNGEVGYASRNYLQLAGGPAPSVGVAVAAPGYVYDEPGYDYYDYGYTYGPSFGFYASPGFRHRHGWRGHRAGMAAGSERGRAIEGWSGERTGNVARRTAPAVARPRRQAASTGGARMVAPARHRDEPCARQRQSGGGAVRRPAWWSCRPPAAALRWRAQPAGGGSGGEQRAGGLGDAGASGC